MECSFKENDKTLSEVKAALKLKEFVCERRKNCEWKEGLKLNVYIMFA